MRVAEIGEITPNITKVVLLLFKWTKFTRDFQLYKGSLKTQFIPRGDPGV